MEKQLMNNLLNLYNETVNENLRAIFKILKNEIGIDNPQLNAQSKDFLDASCKNLTSKWLSGRKTLRTLSVMQAFPEYPEEIIRTSLSIDAMINLLDDLLDEELDRQTRALYIVELIRVLSVYSYQAVPEDVRKAIGDYFNRILSIALAENAYRKLIKAENSFEKIVSYAVQMYDCASLDMDIFVRIVLLWFHIGKEEDVENLIGLARVYRVLTLIRKDIRDMAHDRENKTETAITLAYDKNIFFKDFVKALIDHYNKKSKNISTDGELKEITVNFLNMIENESKEIEKGTQ